MDTESFKENNKDLFEICTCGHTRSTHKNLLIEEGKPILNYKDVKDKKCKVNNCDCQEFILKN